MSAPQPSLAHAVPSRRTLLAVEVLIGYALIQITLWTPRPQQFVWFAVAAAWVMAGILLRWDPPRKLGLGLGSRRGWLLTLAIGASAAGAIVLGGLAAHTVHPLFGVIEPALHALGYAVWALQQEFILQAFFFLAIEEIIGDSRLAVWVTAALFASAHFPSPILMPATFLGGLFFCEMFRRFRTIYPLAIAHALLGLAIAITIPDGMLHHMRVGLGYLTYRG
jgi:CAAX prenyl protease-like protein